MNFGFITIYRNDAAFAKLHWLLFKLFKIKRTTPCGRRKGQSYLCCMLDHNENNSYLIYYERRYEVKCKCCGSTHTSGNGHPKTLKEALDCDFEEEY